MEQYYHISGDGCCIVEYRMPKGFELGKHVHPFGHLSVLVSGKVELEVDGQVSVLEALSGPRVLNIKAHTQHVIRALEYSIWMCVQATDEKDVNNLHTALTNKEF
ncbi:MAG: hypothetical protein NVSMB70_06280 [Chamaesiphon sp.]